jgi:hypothetical protein
VIRPAQSQQIVGDRSVRDEPLEQRVACLLIDESIAVERAHVGIGRLAAVTKNQFEMRIGGNGRRPIGTNRPDVRAYLNALKQPRERRGSLVHKRQLS